MKRRQFLQGLAGLSLLPVGSLGWAASGQIGAPQKKMIVIALRGAVDGLSVVVPHGEREYYRVRPDIAIPKPGVEQGAIDLDGYFGLHPALAGLAPWWQQGNLAFVHAAGSHDGSRSHFDAQDYLESGTPGRKATQDGWMNRLLGALPGPASPTRAVSIGPAMPRILAGAAVASNIPAGSGAGRRTSLDQPKVSQAFDQLYQGDDKYGKMYRQGLSAHQDVRNSLEQEMMMADGGAPHAAGFPAEAAKLATLMRRDPNMQFAFMAVGGWDTHANQGGSTGQLAKHLEAFGKGLTTLTAKLGNMLDDTVIVVMSEFGRTVKQNGNQGTDHGHGNAIWLLGGPVAGGKVYGDWKGLAESNLYEGRDLPVTTDFRSVLAQVAERHLKLPDKRLAQVFPGLAPDARLSAIIRA